MDKKDYEGSLMKNERDKPNALDVYNFLWQGRDFELSCLWQRSIFLGAFLLGIATMYAVYFKDVFICQFASCNQFKGVFGQILVFGFVPILITAIGIIFSELWIMMAKGSKAWFEVYEESISKVNDCNGFWDDKSIREVYGAEIGELIFGELKNNKKPDKCLFSTSAGAFSVSRINVMIGIIFLIVFGLLFFIHIIFTVCLLKSLFSKLKIFDCSFLYMIIFSFLLMPVLFLVCYFIKNDVLSSHLDK